MERAPEKCDSCFGRGWVYVGSAQRDPFAWGLCRKCENPPKWKSVPSKDDGRVY